MPGDGGMRVLLNPAGLDAGAGAAFLTRCFSSPWTEPLYRWYLRRSFGGEPPDRLILADEAQTLAACGLVYRQLRTQDGELHRVSVVVAACTAPGARGRGCYARVLQAAVERSAARGCRALLGFVTADNATGRGLVRLGAAVIPSTYLVSQESARAGHAGLLQLRDAEASHDWPSRAVARVLPPCSPAGFHYPDSSAWASQIVERPHPVETVRIGATCRAVIERVGDTDRLQWLDGDARERTAAIRALLARARGPRRKFFMYSTCPHEAAAARRLGLAARPGYLMALPLGAGDGAVTRGWAGMSWRVQSGDRM
jgi:ribosomal protein S18 acetylase RimI-like enzyme